MTIARFLPVTACVALLAACSPAEDTPMEEAIETGLSEPGEEGEQALIDTSGDMMEPIAQAPDAADDFLRQRFADTGGKVMVASRVIDLDGDRVGEIVAYVYGPMLCGTGGCNLLVLQKQGDTYAVRMDASVAKLPIGFLQPRHNGWRDIAVRVGGGGAEGGFAVMQYDGVRYPSNPTTVATEPAEDAGTVLLGEDAYDNGRVLIEG